MSDETENPVMLKTQLLECRALLVKTQEEAQQLRDANQSLVRCLDESGETIDDIVKQRDELLRQFLLLRSRITPSGFTALSKESRHYQRLPDDWVDHGDSQIWRMSFSPHIQPEFLRPHEWKVSQIEKATENFDDESLRDKQDVQNRSQGDKCKTPSRKPTEDVDRRETNDNDLTDGYQDSPGQSIAESEGLSRKRKTSLWDATEDQQNLQDEALRLRDASKDRSAAPDDRTDTPLAIRAAKRRRTEEEGYKGPKDRRKSVCKECLINRRYCDFNGQCAECQRLGLKCVRQLCEKGDSCLSYRCPLLHPGQWDASDAEWIVEEERRREGGRRIRAAIDSYRPGYA